MTKLIYLHGNQTVPTTISVSESELLRQVINHIKLKNNLCQNWYLSIDHKVMADSHGSRFDDEVVRDATEMDLKIFGLIKLIGECA